MTNYLPPIEWQGNYNHWLVKEKVDSLLKLCRTIGEKMKFWV